MGKKRNFGEYPPKKALKRGVLTNFGVFLLNFGVFTQNFGLPPKIPAPPTSQNPALGAEVGGMVLEWGKKRDFGCHVPQKSVPKWVSHPILGAPTECWGVSPKFWAVPVKFWGSTQNSSPSHPTKIQPWATGVGEMGGKEEFWGVPPKKKLPKSDPLQFRGVPTEFWDFPLNFGRPPPQNLAENTWNDTWNRLGGGNFWEPPQILQLPPRF